MKLLRVPGDYDLGGNERADEEVRRGGRMEQEGVVFSRKTRMREMERRVYLFWDCSWSCFHERAGSARR